MTKELAKILATALVEFIYKDKPSETLHHLDTERMVFMTCLKDGAFDTLNSMIQSKLSRLTEFELRLLDWLSSDTSGEIPMERMKEVVKNRAAILLALAKKELLKDLPRWRKWENGACGNSDNIPIAIVKRGFNYELASTLGIQGERYIMLSDLEKLPGFNED